MKTDKIRQLLNAVNAKSREDEVFEDFALLSDAIYQLDMIEAVVTTAVQKINK